MSQRKQAEDEGSGDDHPNSDAPIPANVVVTLSDVFRTNQLTCLVMREDSWGVKGGLIVLIHTVGAVECV